MRQTIAALMVLGVAGVAAQAASEAPALPRTKEERQIYATEVCGEISTQSATYGLPEHYFARLI